jgi:hypothetical protein
MSDTFQVLTELDVTTAGAGVLLFPIDVGQSFELRALSIWNSGATTVTATHVASISIHRLRGNGDLIPSSFDSACRLNESVSGTGLVTQGALGFTSCALASTQVRAASTAQRLREVTVMPGVPNGGAAAAGAGLDARERLRWVYRMSESEIGPTVRARAAGDREAFWVAVDAPTPALTGARAWLRVIGRLS